MIEQLAGRLSLVLAEAGPNNAPKDNPEWGKAAPTGLFVLLIFVVVCFFLFRSMNGHIKKVPTTFRAGGAAQKSAPAAEPAAASAMASAAEPATTSSRTATRPRLGTPEEMLAEQRAKRRAKVRKAKERARRDDS